MKYIILTLSIVFLTIHSYTQNITLNELFALSNKSNWEQVNESLVNKGWEYYQSSKGDDSHFNTITWSYNKEVYSEKASAWFYLFTYDELPNKLLFTFFNKNVYSSIKNNITSTGMKLIDNSIGDNEIETKYSNSNFIVSIKTSKRERVENQYTSNSITAYSITIIKTRSIYDVNNGNKKIYDSDGKLESEYFLINGKINGIAKTYYPNGNLKVVSNFINGKKQGTSKDYNENGNLSAEFTYINDEINGIFKIYDNGKIKKKGNIFNGVKTGQLTEYDDSGKVIKEYIMKDDTIFSVKFGKYSVNINDTFKEYTIVNDKLNGIYNIYENNLRPPVLVAN